MSEAGDSLLSALFVNYNSWRVCVDAVRTLRDNVAELQAERPLRLQVVVVDNASPQRDPEAEAELEALLAEIHGKLIRHDDNGGYAKGMNLAYQHAEGDLILVSNPDVVFQPGCMRELITAFDRHPKAGAVAPEGFWDPTLEMKLPPNILPTRGDLISLTLAAISLGWLRRYMRRRTKEALLTWDASSDVSLPMLSGCCFLMRRQTIEQIGFFDERFPLYYEDTDLSMRIRKAGLQIVQVQAAQIVHLYNQSGQTDSGLAMERYWISRRLYYQKWYGRLGTFLYDRCKWFLATGFAKRRAHKRQHPQITDMGVHLDERPRIQLPRPADRFMVEMCLDDNFYLATCAFGSGQEWSPGDVLFGHMWSATYYYRVLDLSSGKPVELGLYKYTLQKAMDGAAAPEEVAAGG